MNWLVVGTVGGLVCTLYIWVAGHALRRRHRPGAVPFGLLGVALAWSSGLLAADMVLDRSLSVLFGYGLVFATLLWAGFALEYTGRGPAMTKPRLAGLLAFGFVVGGAQWLFLHVFPLDSPYWLFVSASNLAVLSLGTFGVFLVARAGVTYDDLPIRRALVVAGIGTVLVGIWIVGTVLGEQLDLDQLVERVALGLLGVSGTLCILAQQRYDLLETEPSAGHLARDSIIDEMTEAVLVSDREGQLLDSNRTAERAFDINRSMLGRPLETVIGAPLDGRTGEVLTIEARNGRREYEVRQSPVKEGTDKSVGTVYLLRDVTDQQTHEQQLAVLNRVLRHNLRNGFDSIRGFAEPVRDGSVTADEAENLGQRIGRTASDIGELGAKVSRAGQLLEWESLERDHVDLVELAEAVAEEVTEEYPNGRVDVSAPPPPTAVRTNREILRAVLEELVHNGLKHDDGTDPTVGVELGRTAEGIVITVRDDGPGIPEHERAVLLDGEETPLRHGSGIGLWFVYWGVRRLGGTISFAENHPRGSTVTLTLPRVEPSDGSRGTGI